MNPEGATRVWIKFHGNPAGVETLRINTMAGGIYCMGTSELSMNIAIYRANSGRQTQSTLFEQVIYKCVFMYLTWS